MFRFLFRSADGREIPAAEWLTFWASKYPDQRYADYDDLIAKAKHFTTDDFIRIGKWKDNAWGSKWRPNVAMVAHQIWLQAAAELPGIRVSDENAGAFLADWSERKYEDRYANARVQHKRFGLSRATTLLHFLSGGVHPIFDSRVRSGVKRLTGKSVAQTVEAYLTTYVPLFQAIAAACGTTDFRTVDKALFSYGKRRPHREGPGGDLPVPAAQRQKRVAVDRAALAKLRKIMAESGKTLDEVLEEIRLGKLTME